MHYTHVEKSSPTTQTCVLLLQYSLLLLLSVVICLIKEL